MCKLLVESCKYSHADSLRFKIYHCLLELYKNNIFHSPWLLFIRDVLNDTGLSYVWLSQGEGIDEVWLKKSLHRILFDQFVTEWRSDMESSTKCDYYKHFKLVLEPEWFLSGVSRKIAKLILKLRTCNHKLPIETGRYSNIDRRLRICRSCTLGKVGDEFHYMFECVNPDIVAARNDYLPGFYSEQPTIEKFYHLLQNLKSEPLVRDVSKLVKVIFRTV
jgi:hypothetical protein